MDGVLADREFVAGSRYTIADVRLFCTTDFAWMMGERYDPALVNLVR